MHESIDDNIEKIVTNVDFQRHLSGVFQSY